VVSGMEIVGAGLTVAGGVMKANAVNQQAKAQATAQRYQADQMRIQSEYDRIAQTQDEATRRLNLGKSLESIAAVEAGRGVGMTSPSVTAISEDVADRGERDIATGKLTAGAKIERERSQAGLLEQQAQFTESSGKQAALIDLVGTGASVFNLANYGKTKSSLI
jgi:hypothetical protein